MDVEIKKESSEIVCSKCGKEKLKKLIPISKEHGELKPGAYRCVKSGAIRHPIPIESGT